MGSSKIHIENTSKSSCSRVENTPRRAENWKQWKRKHQQDINHQNDRKDSWQFFLFFFNQGDRLFRLPVTIAFLRRTNQNPELPQHVTCSVQFSTKTMTVGKQQTDVTDIMGTDTVSSPSLTNRQWIKCHFYKSVHRLKETVPIATKGQRSNPAKTTRL